MKTHAVRRGKTILYGLVGLGFLLRVFHLGNQSLWFDEIITVHLAQLPLLAGLDGLLGQGIQLTPFFHWVVKLWLFTGTSEWALRFPAVVFSVLAIPLMYRLGKLYFNVSVGLFAAAIIAVNPFQVWYAQEVRAYSLLTFSAIGVMTAFGLLLKKGTWRHLAALTLFNIIGINAHYFILLLTTVQFVFILAYFKKYFRLLRGWLLAQLLSIITLLPWFWYIFHRQHFATGIGWIPKPTIWDPLLTIWNFTIGYQERTTLTIILSLIIVAVTFVRGLIYAKRIKPFGLLTILWFFLPLMLVWILSQGHISFYVDRYFLVVSPALILLLAVGVTKIGHLKIKWGLGLALLLAMLYGTGQIFFNAAYFSKDDWRTMATKLRRAAQPGDGLVTCTDGYRLALDYYGLGTAFPTEKQYFLYPADFDFNKVFSSNKRLWVVSVNPRHPQHHLGYSYNPPLDQTKLSATTQKWLVDFPPKMTTVSGITAFLYTLQSPTDLNQLITWVCNRE